MFSVFNGGEYTPTIYGKQGDLGSKVLKPRPTGITWKAGSVVNVSWYIAFNHAGGCESLCSHSLLALSRRLFLPLSPSL
eukprot:COSAG02_NODE_2512_length_8621_cov_278.639062_10_plen_79_part_00